MSEWNMKHFKHKVSAESYLWSLSTHTTSLIKNRFQFKPSIIIVIITIIVIIVIITIIVIIVIITIIVMYAQGGQK